MRGLLALIPLLCLLASLLGGTVLHAAELASAGEVTAATAWLHAEGDHDQVPADADKDYPHHHTICHGHDLAAPMRNCTAPRVPLAMAAPRPVADSLPLAPPPASLLRPPIA